MVSELTRILQVFCYVVSSDQAWWHFLPSRIFRTSWEVFFWFSNVPQRDVTFKFYSSNAESFLFLSLAWKALHRTYFFKISNSFVNGTACHAHPSRCLPKRILFFIFILASSIASLLGNRTEQFPRHFLWESWSPLRSFWLIEYWHFPLLKLIVALLLLPDIASRWFWPFHEINTTLKIYLHRSEFYWV